MIGGLLASCTQQTAYDASGSFEADEIIISSEATGTIQAFNLVEGQDIPAGAILGYIDTTQLYLKKSQLEMQKQAVVSRKPNINTQMAALEEQLKTAEVEKKRLTNLLTGEAATQKQLDDVNATINVLKQQIAAQRLNLENNSEGIESEAAAIDLQIKQINDQIKKSILVNPVKGTVLAKYANANEMTTTGKALYKIADLSVVSLRAYISGDQLMQLKLNQSVTVRTDDGKGGFKEAQGKVTWINDKAEFTPKTIQTKNERANMVYAIKVKLVNDGSYKIGMYGELKFE
jgi:HlyD family secretion protein